ncbi:MAG: hypothetical protein ABIR33_00210 [Pyrinomonadaceae bacterium]
MRFFALIIVAIAFVSASAQVKTFKWSDDLCEYSGTYDSKKYNEVKLRNTHRLLFGQDLRLDSVGATVWKYEDISKLDVALLDTKYKDLIDELEHFEYVSTPFTDVVLVARLKETRQLYQLVRTTMAAYTDPPVIRKYQGAVACKLNYGEPIIAGGESLITAWRKVNLESQSKNGDPRRLQRRWDEENALPDRLKFALVETMSFGWWNCANQEIKYADENFGSRVDKEFKKLFIRTRTIRCDEP